MNNNTKNTNYEIPEEVLELLPWYAIGKLSAEDQVIFEKALLIYPVLEKQLEQELQMIEIVSADNSLLNLSVISPQEERLKSVFNMIDIAEAQDQYKDHIESDNANSLFEKFKNIFDTLMPTAGGMPQYARVASVGVLVLSVAVLTAFVAPLFTEQSEFLPASANSQSGVEKTSLINSSTTVLLVGFNGTSIELGNIEILKDKLLKIQTVPDKEGIYQISFKQPLNDAEIKQTIDALLKQKELIWFAGESF